MMGKESPPQSYSIFLSATACPQLTVPVHVNTGNISLLFTGSACVVSMDATCVQKSPHLFPDKKAECCFVQVDCRHG